MSDARNMRLRVRIISTRTASPRSAFRLHASYVGSGKFWHNNISRLYSRKREGGSGNFPDIICARIAMKQRRYFWLFPFDSMPGLSSIEVNALDAILMNIRWNIFFSVHVAKSRVSMHVRFLRRLANALRLSSVITCWGARRTGLLRGRYCSPFRISILRQPTRFEFLCWKI